jgi:hypothetical protein
MGKDDEATAGNYLDPIPHLYVGSDEDLPTMAKCMAKAPGE